jgi:hypothetical protein
VSVVVREERRPGEFLYHRNTEAPKRPTPLTEANTSQELPPELDEVLSPPNESLEEPLEVLLDEPPEGAPTRARGARDGALVIDTTVVILVVSGAWENAENESGWANVLLIGGLMERLGLREDVVTETDRETSVRVGTKDGKKYSEESVASEADGVKVVVLFWAIELAVSTDG